MNASTRSSVRRVCVFRGRPSTGARALAGVLSGSTNRLRNSRFNPSRFAAVINWGTTSCPDSPNVINSSQAITEAVDKGLLCDKLIAAGDVRIPELLNEEQARQRLQQGRKVVVRSLLRASEGRGLRVISPGETLPTHIDGARVRQYSKYVPKRREYRIHIADGVGVFYIQQKKRRRECNEVDYHVRNTSNGWIFAHNEIDPVPSDVMRQAERGFRATDLDFGAVDVIWNERSDKAWLLEINTAPGMEGETLNKYAGMLQELIQMKGLMNGQR